MNARRDFLAFAACLLAARAILPPSGRAETAGSARRELEQMALTDPTTARMLKWWDGASRHERLCFTLGCKRVLDGVPMEEVGRLFRLDVANPSRAISI